MQVATILFVTKFAKKATHYVHKDVSMGQTVVSSREMITSPFDS